MTVSGVRSSCEASATNARWPANASVRRSSMWLKASASTLTSSPWPPGSWMRGCRSPASTRAATAAILRSGRDTRVPIRYEAEQRAGERQQPGEDERAGDAALGVCDGRQRLPHPDR